MVSHSENLRHLKEALRSRFEVHQSYHVIGGYNNKKARFELETTNRREVEVSTALFAKATSGVPVRSTVPCGETPYGGGVGSTAHCTSGEVPCGLCETCGRGDEAWATTAT